MSPSDDRNAPLPRMAKRDALEWAKNYTERMARLTGVELTPSSAKTNFEECVGADDEVAEDGRYSLFYYVDSPAPVTEHTRIVRKLRSELAQRGYEVTSYREYRDSYESAAFSARNKKNGYSVEADTVGSGKTKPQAFNFAVRTACLLPPGVKQRQFGARDFNVSGSSDEMTSRS